MRKYCSILLLLMFFFLSCSKTKLTPLPEYKASSGTELDAAYIHLANICYDNNYTYILDDRYGYHQFFRINETTGKMENIKRYNELKSFAVSEQYLYVARANVYPQVFYSLYRVNKNNYDDSLLINSRMLYSYLVYVDGWLYGTNQLGDLCKVDTATGNGVEILTTSDTKLSLTSFTSYINSSKFYNGWWMFVNDNFNYLLKVKMDGSKQIDTIQSVKTPIFAVHNNRIYFSQVRPDYMSVSSKTRYKNCLASVDFEGGPVTIEDSTNIMYCNTVSNYGNLLLIGDGRFIKTFDPISKKVTTIGAMDVFVNEFGSTMPSYPFFNSNTGGVYYSAYNDKFPIYKLK